MKTVIQSRLGRTTIGLSLLIVALFAAYVYMHPGRAYAATSQLASGTLTSSTSSAFTFSGTNGFDVVNYSTTIYVYGLLGTDSGTASTANADFIVAPRSHFLYIPGINAKKVVSGVKIYTTDTSVSATVRAFN
jgi:hypothetical protein